MDALFFSTFIVTSVLLIIIPGPNVLVVVSTSLSHGSKRGLQTVLGTSSAMAIQLIIAALGTTWFVASLTRGFDWLRWAGVAYLVYLGVSQFFRLARNNDSTGNISASGSFARGFIVSLTNPKTILFFGAFLPQFVTPHADYSNQIIILSLTFLLLATLLDGMYALLAGYLRGQLASRKRHYFQNGISGLLYLTAGAWLALVRKT